MKKELLMCIISSLGMISCQNDELDSMPDELITREINKIETEWKEGVIKEENVRTGEEKVETSMSYEDRLIYFEFLSRNNGHIIDDYTGPTRTATYDESKFGLVLKAQSVSCAPYREFRFVMDCEDDDTTSYTSGNTGATYVDSDGNMNFIFCVIPVANMTNGLYKKDNTYTRFFDTEDSNTNNQYFVNGIRTDSQFLNSTNWGITKDSNGNITFYFLNGNWGSGTTGFGHKTGSNNGIIYTDDEDDDNTNKWNVPTPLAPESGLGLFTEYEKNTGIKVHFDF